MPLYRRFHDRFGTAGVVLGVIAMIVALTGTAFAASGGLNSKQKKEVKAIAKSFQGTGPAGAVGAPGAAGANGKDGAPGAAGTAGTDGKSVEAEAVGAGAKCAEGGTVFKIGGVEKGKACNGKDGEAGEPGAIHPGETLPSEATETGTWSFNSAVSAAEQLIFATASFTVPLAAPLPNANVHVAPNANCPGTVEEPKAAAGHLCVYASPLVLAKFVSALEPSLKDISPLGAPSFDETGGASTSGARLNFASETTGTPRYGFGTWAVTAAP